MSVSAEQSSIREAPAHFGGLLKPIRTERQAADSVLRNCAKS